MKDVFYEALQLFGYRDNAWDEGSGQPAVLKDNRLSLIYHNDTKFTPVRYSNLDDWEKRKKELREQVLLSAGLWPMPKKCELNSRVFDKKVFDGFSVEKVIFESYPGLSVTGNLFKPEKMDSQCPAILNAHGHWENGRLEHSDLSDIPTRCANFAKMGFISLAYDMIGRQDSLQVNHQYGGAKQELWSMGAFGLQLWNSIRCLDFLESLSEVDMNRIGCTGASGGATQTFFLTAVDERIKAAVNVNMISASMQGGCNCEGAPGLRFGTNNVEIAYMTAPRPMLLIGSTGDWTNQLPVVEYPAIHSLYGLYGKSHQLEYFYQDAGHNYNKKAREKAYHWFARKLLHQDVAWREQVIDFGDINLLKIFPEHAASNGIQSNQELFEFQKRDRLHAINELWKTDSASASLIFFKAMKHVFGLRQSPSKSITEMHGVNVEVDGYDIVRSLIGTEAGGEQIPITIVNKKGIHNKKTIVLLHPEGKMAAFKDNGWRTIVEGLLDEGCTIASADLFLTGEFHRPGCTSGRESGICNHFTTYNCTDVALRVQDVVLVFQYIQQKNGGEVCLGGIKEAGLWCLAALPFLENANKVLIDCGSLGISGDDHYVDKFFVPGFLAAGGFESSIQLSTPNELTLINVKNQEEIGFIRRVYDDIGNKVLKVFDSVPTAPWQD